MRKITVLALGAALSFAALPALAQSSPSTGPSPGTSTSNPNNAANPAGMGTGNSTTRSNDEAPPAGSAGTRALRPGQNPDGTPRSQTPGNGPELPGMGGGQGK